MLLRVVDIETTGQAPPAENIEFGRVDVRRAESEWQIGRPMARLYRPLNGIPPETMAVHHITEMDMKPDTPVCTADRLRLAVWSGDAPDGLVAHNSSFEQMFIAEDVTDALPWICTYKVALHVWPDAPRHSNQVLRYWRNLVLDPALAMPPHRASPDAYVTACLLVELLRHATVDQMVAWTVAAQAVAEASIRQAPGSYLGGGAARLPAMDDAADRHGPGRRLVCRAGSCATDKRFMIWMGQSGCFAGQAVPGMVSP